MQPYSLHMNIYLHILFLMGSNSTLKNAVRNAIGPIATPDFIIYSELPKVIMYGLFWFMRCWNSFLLLCLFRSRIVLCLFYGWKVVLFVVHFHYFVSLPQFSLFLIWYDIWYLDSLWQDHASHFAQDRSWWGGFHWRCQHPGRPCGKPVSLVMCAYI